VSLASVIEVSIRGSINCGQAIGRSISATVSGGSIDNARVRVVNRYDSAIGGCAINHLFGGCSSEI
jgi:hypothetical protein